MNLRFTRSLLIVLPILVLGIPAYAYLNPGVAACAISGDTQVKSTAQNQLLADSTARIQNKFGMPESKPIVIFFDDSKSFWPLKLNEYGSTNFIGNKVCVIVGSKGQNIDVTAHELMHSEIAYRVGYWRRFMQLPVWFDEGLGMQVDDRTNYDLSESDSARADYVTALTTGGAFFVPNDKALTKNYASAKAVVKKWVASTGESTVYRQLERIRAGESFEAIYGRKK